LAWFPTVYDQQRLPSGVAGKAVGYHPTGMLALNWFVPYRYADRVEVAGGRVEGLLVRREARLKGIRRETADIGTAAAAPWLYIS